MTREVEREVCAWCHELRPRSGLARARWIDATALICRDRQGCYDRFRAWMIRHGHRVVVDGKLWPARLLTADGQVPS
jgi:hypothetical protein